MFDLETIRILRQEPKTLNDDAGPWRKAKWIYSDASAILER